MIEVLEFTPNNSLGEGIFTQKGLIAWVDINSKKLFLMGEGASFVEEIETPFVLSKVLSARDKELTLLSEFGVAIYLMGSKKWIYHPFLFGDAFRSNDGCILNDGSVLIGVMSKIDPSKQAGSVWRYNKGEYKKVLDGIYIPNTFVLINDIDVLITDSKVALTKVYRQNSDVFKEVGVFYKCDDHSTPDGGCKYNNHVYIACWGGACVKKIDLEGRLVGKIELPVTYPTSCSILNDYMYITSAACELPAYNGDGADGKIIKVKLSEAIS